MLENYRKDKYGVVSQIDRLPFEYGYEYSLIRDQFGLAGLQMGYLRLGYLFGTLGDVSVKNILDIGYGNGDFLEAARNIIPKCYGHDIVDDFPLPDNCTFVEDALSDYYDVITMFDSLEHIPDISFVKNLKCKYLYISLPWCHYFSDEWFENWKHRRPDEHLWHFDDKSLIRFMHSSGYQPLAISNIEDAIRRSDGDYNNILTGVFEKK